MTKETLAFAPAVALCAPRSTANDEMCSLGMKGKMRASGRRIY